MPRDIGVTVGIGGEDQGLTRASRRGQRDLRGFQREADRTEKSVDGLNTSLLSNVNTFTAWSAAVGGAAAVAGVGLLERFTEQAVEFDRWARVLNTSTTELRALEGVGRQYNLQLEDTADFLKEIQNRAFDATTGQQ